MAGPDGALAALGPGSVWVDLTTNSRDLVLELASGAPDGVAVVDSPGDGRGRRRPTGNAHAVRGRRPGGGGWGAAGAGALGDSHRVRAAGFGQRREAGHQPAVVRGRGRAGGRASRWDWPTASNSGRCGRPSWPAWETASWPAMTLPASSPATTTRRSRCRCASRIWACWPAWSRVSLADLPVTAAARSAFERAAARYGLDAGEMCVARRIEDDAGMSMRLDGDWTPHWEK